MVVVLDQRRRVDCGNARPLEILELGAAMLTGLASLLLFGRRKRSWLYFIAGAIAVFVPLVGVDVLRTIGISAN